jgi:putative transcriptional regulator
LTSGQANVTKQAGMQAGDELRNRLKVLRAERDWSQAELGGRLGVSRQAVNAIETGKYDPSLPLAFKIARLFDLQIEDVFDDSDGAGRNG